MKKVNKRGFVLAETIAISVVVITALIIIYKQFININNSYYKTFSYNNVNDVYLVNNLRNLILENDKKNLYNLINEENLYIDITKCSNYSSYFIEYMYCDSLIDAIDAKMVIITKYDTTNLSNNINNYDFSENMKTFIKNSKSKEDGYRLVVEFDDTIASLKLD